MKNYKFTIRGNQYDVEISSIEDNIAEIEVNGTHYSVEIHREMKKTTKTPKLVRSKVPEPSPEERKVKQHSGGGTTAIKAPLPGSIFKLLVKEGDAVKEGDKLLVMEAMKMENDVLAEKSGTITSIKVAVGDSVLQNDVLLEIG